MVSYHVWQNVLACVRVRNCYYSNWLQMGLFFGTKITLQVFSFKIVVNFALWIESFELVWSFKNEVLLHTVLAEHRNVQKKSPSLFWSFKSPNIEFAMPNWQHIYKENTNRIISVPNIAPFVIHWYINTSTTNLLLNIPYHKLLAQMDTKCDLYNYSVVLFGSFFHL